MTTVKARPKKTAAAKKEQVGVILDTAALRRATHTAKYSEILLIVTDIVRDCPNATGQEIINVCHEYALKKYRPGLCDHREVKDMLLLTCPNIPAKTIEKILNRCR
jgi:hypothetical protein